MYLHVIVTNMHYTLRTMKFVPVYVTVSFPGAAQCKPNTILDSGLLATWAFNRHT